MQQSINIYEFMDKHNCTPIQRRQLMAFYIAMKIAPSINIIHWLSKTSKLI